MDKPTRADIDRRKMRATRRRNTEQAIAKAVADFLQGREAAACMGDIVKAVRENRV